MLEYFRANVLKKLKMKKAHSGTSLSHVHNETQMLQRKKSKCSFVRSVSCLLSHVMVDAVADSITGILLVPNVVLNSQFSRNQK